MSSLFKIAVVQYWLQNRWLDAEGNPCTEGTPGARFVERRRVRPGTPGARKVKRKSTKWYGRLPGSSKAIPLSANKVAAQQMLAALVTNAELGKVGINDPFEAHRKLPLADHLADWQADLMAGGATAKHVRQTVACARRVLDGCRFVFIADMSASAVQRFLAELRDRRPALPALDAAKAEYTKGETAAAVGVKVSAVTALIRHTAWRPRATARLGATRGRRWKPSAPFAAGGEALRPATFTLTP